MVMELLDGFDLEHRLEGGPLSVEEAVEHVVQACDALSEAHHLRIVHRDIKPANLFLASRAPRPPILKIIDFGISKVVPRPGAPGLATLELTAGTPAYMSPEQVHGEEVDARADFWSLGVVLFELLTRELPFPFTDAQTLLEQICTATPRSVRSLRPELPEALDEVIRRCLARDRTNRFGSATELADALQPFRSADLLGASGDISAVVRPVVSDASRQAPTVVVRPKTGLHRAAVMGAIALTALAAIGAGLIGVVLLRKHEAAPAATVAVIPTASVASPQPENADAPPPPPPPAVDSPPPVASSSATPKATAGKSRPRAPSKTHSSAPTGSDRSMFGERK
jgi:serine/threonine-protein kinase